MRSLLDSPTFKIVGEGRVFKNYGLHGMVGGYLRELLAISDG